MSAVTSSSLAPAASTGNLTHASTGIAPQADKLAIVFVTENAGTTITVNIEGSLDPGTVADGSSNWFQIPFLTGASAESVTPPVVTTQSANLYFLALPTARFYRKLRLRTTANTGMNYHADLHQIFRN